MAKSNDKTDTEKNEKKWITTEPPKPETGEASQTQQRRQVQLDLSKMVTAYANFCRVTGTPEELIIDFGLNIQPMGTPGEPLGINQRIIVNFFTAKRLLGALQMAVQRHEAAFGVLETNVQKRVTPGAGQQAP